MKIIKHLRIFTIGIFLLIDVSFSSGTALTFMPYFASTYYSTGSILHSEKDGNSNLTHFQLGAKKSDGSFTISGFFQFTSAQNLDFNSTYINPDLNIEMNRGYIETKRIHFRPRLESTTNLGDTEILLLFFQIIYQVTHKQGFHGKCPRP